MLAKHRLYWLIALVLALALVVTACAAPPASEQPAEPAAPEPAEPAAAEPAAPVKPVVLRIGWNGSPDTLNPGTAVLSEAYTIFELVFSSLVHLSPDGSYVPDLAESWQVSDDGRVWTFKIRDDMAWHDGEPVTAQDVAFTFNMVAAHEDFPFLPVYTTYFDSVETLDDHTLQITLSEAIPNMESQIVFLFILPEHIWSQLGSATAESEFENLEMVGSGPFQMLDYAQGEFVRLGAVKSHPFWAPKVDEVIFQTFDNPDALVQAIVAGQVDMITEMPNTAVPILRNNAKVDLVVGAPLFPSVMDIIPNQTTPENCPVDDGVCSGHPALRDRQVRLALAYATDKQKIIDVVLLGLGAPGLTLIPDSLTPYYNDSIEDFPFDIEEAKRILDEAGYLDSDGDGVREMPDGANPLIFRMNWANDSSNNPRIAELLKETWEQIGVRVQPQALDPDTLTAVCCPVFDFDIILWGWGSDPDPGFLLSVHLTDEIATGNSETGYSNPEYDALYNQQATALDLEERKAIIWQMQEILHNDVAYIIPYYEQAVQAYRNDRFRGWITDAGRISLDDPTSLVIVEPVQ